MNCVEFQTLLDALPSDAPLVFKTDAGAIGAGYHVTELKLATISGIDCGAQTEHWSEATLQLLDAPGDEHMAAGKLESILTKSIEAVPGLGSGAFRVEFSHGNKGLHLYAAKKPVLENGSIVVELSPLSAICKPASRSAFLSSATNCCGNSQVAEEHDPVTTRNDVEPAACCGGPAPQGVDACCVKDADAKAAGESGCGCGTGTATIQKSAGQKAAQACCG